VFKGLFSLVASCALSGTKAQASRKEIAFERNPNDFKFFTFLSTF
jgi:hypothetical protein